MDKVLRELGVLGRRAPDGPAEKRAWPADKGAGRRKMMVKASEAETARRRWDELPPWQQAGIVALSAVEIVLTTAAVVDLVRRPRDQVRGPKTLWALGLTVQPFGPIAYLALARRRS